MQKNLSLFALSCLCLLPISRTHTGFSASSTRLPNRVENPIEFKAGATIAEMTAELMQAFNKASKQQSKKTTQRPLQKAALTIKLSVAKKQKKASTIHASIQKIKVTKGKQKRNIRKANKSCFAHTGSKRQRAQCLKALKKAKSSH